MNVAEFLDPTDWFRPEGGPRYLQLRKRINEGVERRLLVPGNSLPPEREIASITEFSRVTVRKAIQLLVDEGVIIQRQGSGSYVSSKPVKIDQKLSRLTSFSEDMARRGKNSTSRWLERGLFLPSPDEIKALGLGAEDSVARIARLRLADGEPLAIERASLRTDILPNPLIVDTSLYEVLEQAGNRPVRAVQKITAINLAKREAEMLGVLPGVAGLHIERTSYLEDGRVAEFTMSLYRGDAYNFVAELRLLKE